jgi:hypothetical protein
VEALKERLALRTNVQAEFRKASGALKSMMNEQQKLTETMVSVNRKLMKEDAKQTLKRERGFSSGRNSTYTNSMRLADAAKVSAAWKDALKVEATIQIGKKSEIQLSKTVPTIAGGKEKSGGGGEIMGGKLSSTPRR